MGRIDRAGYGVASGEADLIIRRMSDDNDERRLEKAIRQMEGVLDVQVDLATEHALVRYIPTHPQPGRDPKSRGEQRF